MDCTVRSNDRDSERVKKYYYPCSVDHNATEIQIKLTRTENDTFSIAM